jgi:hypothetical protein
MRAIWKWIIGIAIVLVVVGLIVGGVFLVRSHLYNGIARVVQVPGGRVPFNGRQPYNGPNWMMPYGGRGYPMMGGRFGFGLAPFVGILGFLFFAGLVTLVILGIIWLARSQRRPQATATPMTMTAAQTPPPPQAASVRVCKKCGQPVPEGASYCPNCGKKQ